MINIIIHQENANQTTLRFHFTPSERLKSIKEMSVHACEKIAKVEHLIIIVRMQTCTFFMEITGGFSSELDIDTLSTSTYTSLWHIPEGLYILLHKYLLIQVHYWSSYNSQI